MEENTKGPNELSRKRKIEPELLKPPLPKHICGTFPRGTSSSTRARRGGGNSSTINSSARTRYCRMQPVREGLNRRYRSYGPTLCNIYEDCQLIFENHNGYNSSENEMNNNADVVLRLFDRVPTVHDVSSKAQLVNQDAHQDSGMKTIDKEFEEYFSMLLL